MGFRELVCQSSRCACSNRKVPSPICLVSPNPKDLISTAAKSWMAPLNYIGCVECENALTSPCGSRLVSRLSGPLK
ncbi:hypothetical protein VTO73DRAFT_9736 [Trametes versicolor]